MRRLLALAFVLLVILLAGCGGGGGSGGTPTIPLESTIRQMQPGDQWEYAASGTVRNQEGTFAITGAWSETITSDTVQTPTGITAMVVLLSGTLSGPGGSLVLAGRFYETQDATGTIWCHGGIDSEGVEWWVLNPGEGCYIDVKSPLGIGTSWIADVLRSTGEQDLEGYTVVGTETITVPAGNFECYKLSGNGRFQGFPAILQDWYAPQIGNYIRSRAVFSNVEQHMYFDLTANLIRRTRQD